MNYELHHGDCLEVMATMPDNSVTAVVTDPPYGLGETPDITELMQQWITEGHAETGKGFMGRNWDVVPGPVYWREMYRIAKPGAYLLAMCGTRTVDLMSIAIRFGGWVKFDEISYHMGQGLPPIIDYCYGSGFPKSMAIDKAIDRHLGKSDERVVVGANPNHRAVSGVNYNGIYSGGNTGNHSITAPATPEAATWAGYGSALKPAHEIILCFRKPVDGTYANNALVHGCGGLNIDATRVDSGGTHGSAKSAFLGAGYDAPEHNGPHRKYGKGIGGIVAPPHPSGRFPANIIWDGSDAIKAEFDKAGESKSMSSMRGLRGRHDAGDRSNQRTKPYTNTHRGHDDSGSAARFFTVCPPDVPRLVYHAKSSSAERNEGLGDVDNTHCTVKPLSLFRWMVKLVRQPANTLILDPFGGSGTTGVAAMLEGCDTIIIEREADYIPIISARLKHFEDEANMKPVTVKGRATDTADLPLFT